MALTEREDAALAAAAEAARAYRRGDHARAVNPAADYQAMLDAFREPVPEAGTEADAVIADLAARAAPGLMGMTHPNFHGWVVGASHPAGVAADWLTSAWGQCGGFAEPTPAASAVEEVAAGWLLDLLGLPPGAGVGFGTGATMANFTALASARTALLDRHGWDVEAKGLFGAPEINVVLGGEAHSSIYLTLRLLGFGAGRVHIAAADRQGRMRPDALAATLAPLTGPTLVCLQAGNVNSGAFDPFADLIPIAHDHGAWVHVDGAFGLWARACRALDPLTVGIEAADSWAADAHKWLQVPYDCGISIVADPRPMRRAMDITASYLAHSAHRQPEAHSPEMSRRARAFAVWAVVKALGRTGIDAMIARHCATARHIAGLLTAEPGLAVLNHVVLNQVVLACAAGPEYDGPEADRLTAATLAAVQAGGRAYPSHGAWRGRAIIRISVSAGPTGIADGTRTAEAIVDAWRQVRGGVRNAAVSP